jgi:hypothetical protein
MKNTPQTENWKVDIRVGVVAVYPDNEITQSYLPCIPPSELCIYYRPGICVMDSNGSFAYWDNAPGAIKEANLIAAAPKLHKALILAQAILDTQVFSRHPDDAITNELKGIIKQALNAVEGK